MDGLSYRLGTDIPLDPLASQENGPLVILFYNWFWEVDPAANLPAGCPAHCEITSDPSRFKEADVVVFHVPSMPTWSRVQKRPHQKWVAWSLESDVCYPHLQDPKFMALFDLTMTYRLDSDVPVLYLDPSVASALRTPPQAKTAEAPAVLFASNTRELSGRSKYLSELMKYMRVDSYGRWKRNQDLPEDSGRQTKLDTLARYKFTLAFENSLTRDYVSEKFFDPLIAGSVPVYLGAPNIEDFAPGDHCFIHAAAFQGPRELSEYLGALAGDPVRYAAYLAWKERPFLPGFLELVEAQRADFRCRLCQKLQALEEPVTPYKTLA